MAISLLSSRIAAAAEPEPWSDADPPGPPERWALGNFGVRGTAEYRAQWQLIDPIALNSISSRRASWIEHRLRLDGAVDWQDRVRIVTSLDLLDGVLWGDNGTLGQDPAPNSGANVTTRNPNAVRPCIGVLGDGDPLEKDSYGYVDCEGNQLRVRHLYGDVVTPIGMFRIGRQATTLGTALVAADGNGRTNRFGISRTGNVVDRVLFVTKPLEALRPEAARDRAEDRGFFVALGYDRLVTDEVRLADDDLNQVVASLRLLAPTFAPERGLELGLYNAYRWDEAHGTQVDVLGARAFVRIGDLRAGAEAVITLGSTREVSEAYSLVNNDPVTDQAIRQAGARAVVRYDRPRWGAYLELDYASGDGDPDTRTSLDQLYFAEDANVGLLLFEHILAFQSARAAAAGNELLRRLGAATFPADVVSTRGAFTNAVALFPQMDVRPVPSVLLRGGVLVAWAAQRTVDPVASLRRKDGSTIEDDLVNLNGGEPGDFYGVELDGRFQWRYLEHFALDLEGALFFPGDALEDVNGQAARSGLLQARSTFWF
jgi:hypothetical protein